MKILAQKGIERSSARAPVWAPCRKKEPHVMGEVELTREEIAIRERIIQAYSPERRYEIEHFADMFSPADFSAVTVAPLSRLEAAARVPDPGRALRRRASKRSRRG